MAAREDAWIAELQQLRDRGLERQIRQYPEAGGKIRVDDRLLLNFSSNDYLGLARNPDVMASSESALRRWGAGSGASRLVTGSLPCHDELDQRLAVCKGYPAALVFGSGFLANVGIIPALLERTDWIVVDRLAHASLIDAAILSRAVLHRFQHNDAVHLDAILGKKPSAVKCLIVTESVFSMDGDLAPLKAIADVAQRHEALLMVDEAHATGIFGPGGGGLVRELNLESCVAIAMGTLSKALGSYGGFVACSETLRSILVNRARSLIFSTSLPPAVIGAALGALQYLETHPSLGAMLLDRSARFRARLHAAGFQTGGSASQIIPLIVGDNHKTLRFAQRLQKHGILTVAIRPPTVPPGTARLRLSVTLDHSPEDLEQAADILVRDARDEGIL
ncbi:MAG: 8-amino-7-oxononanoate synthase [Verrucomicrobia bacterium]|nr:8-amino-7-oxononanoate synthase [Verrucomicrobiota bacterium]MCG2681900.1 8-amino-7-oxononanoate synthase [Kiritimatiellia bacterium]MBU4246740.1 8-amino-7-oxononanoate synthase [Verrucomicrobiota bacterium]MBU4291161.1 8-amino-7-oxononanoate synthase [Verrucomicrobiota bacterium]MBU4428293.1 8-amino-7-oxononanoate synthase [Verrucomicrobiota bacterium]